MQTFILKCMCSILHASHEVVDASPKVRKVSLIISSYQHTHNTGQNTNFFKKKQKKTNSSFPKVLHELNQVDMLGLGNASKYLQYNVQMPEHARQHQKTLACGTNDLTPLVDTPSFYCCQPPKGTFPSVSLCNALNIHLASVYIITIVKDILDTS